MVMLCSDVFPKGVDTPQFGFPRHRNAKPCVFQIGIKIQQIGSLGKEQELMLCIFTDLCKYLVSPFRLPSGEIAHAGKKKVLRTDGYNPQEEQFRNTRKLLEQLIGSDADILICTKSDLVVRDIALPVDCSHPSQNR